MSLLSPSSTLQTLTVELLWLHSYETEFSKLNLYRQPDANVRVLELKVGVR